MKRFQKMLLKFLRNLSIVSIIIGIIVFVIAKATGFSLVEAYQYAGIICILIGCLSVVGNMSMTSNPTYFQAKSVSSKSINDGLREDFMSKLGNYRLLLLLLAVGILLIAFSFLLDAMHI